MCKTKRAILFCLACVSLILAACNAAGGQEPTPYRPPTAVILPSPTILPPSTPEAPRPTPTPPCTDNLSFREDLTIPDGSQVSPGQELDKRWRVVNSGTCNWDDRYRLKLIAGPEMGATKEQTLYPARSGTEPMIRIIFTAPAEPGAYRSAWQAYNPQGQPFGDPFFIEVVVMQ